MKTENRRKGSGCPVKVTVMGDQGAGTCSAPTSLLASSVAARSLTSSVAIVGFTKTTKERKRTVLIDSKQIKTQNVVALGIAKHQSRARRTCQRKEIRKRNQDFQHKCESASLPAKMWCVGDVSFKSLRISPRKI